MGSESFLAKIFTKQRLVAWISAAAIAIGAATAGMQNDEVKKIVCEK